MMSLIVLLGCIVNNSLIHTVMQGVGYMHLLYNQTQSLYEVYDNRLPSFVSKL